MSEASLTWCRDEENERLYEWKAASTWIADSSEGCKRSMTAQVIGRPSDASDQTGIFMSHDYKDQQNRRRTLENYKHNCSQKQGAQRIQSDALQQRQAQRQATGRNSEEECRLDGQVGLEYGKANCSHQISRHEPSAENSEGSESSEQIGMDCQREPQNSCLEETVEYIGNSRIPVCGWIQACR